MCESIKAEALKIGESAMKKEEKALVEKVKKWFGFKPYEDLLGSQVEEVDLSIQCQFTKNQVSRPARTKDCS